MSEKPRSLILDLFGDYLRYADAEVRLSHLTTLLGAFDVPAPTVRVTISRLRRERWFTSHRAGRETIYRLTPELLELLDEGRRRIFAVPTNEWSGQWTMVVYQLRESERRTRNRLRKALAWHGFGPLATSTWLAAGDRRAEAHDVTDALTDDQVVIVTCISDGHEHDLDLAHRCWDLNELSEDYAAFVREHRGLLKQAGRLRGAEALVARTRLIHAFRHFPFRDPGLPEALRPKPWPGDEAHRLFRQTHAALGPAARSYVGSVVRRELPDSEAVEP